jgi:hypothetical protein
VNPRAPLLVPSKRFRRSVEALNDVNRDHVARALKLFIKAPMHPGLNFEKVKATAFCTIRATRGIRIVLRKVASQTYDLVDVGEHDFIYKKYG